MHIRFFTLAAAAAALSTTAPALAAAVSPGVPGRTTVAFGVANRASATASSPSGTPVTDAKQDYQTSATIGQFAALATAFASDNALAVGQAGARLDIDFANAGSASIRYRGSSTAASDVAAGLASGSGGMFFDYSFQALANADFSLSYLFSGPVLGCCGNRIELRDFTGARLLFSQGIAGTATSGTLTASLLAGSSYLLSIGKGQYEGVDAARVQGTGFQTVGFDDVIRFSITDPTAAGAVPEPATWAMLLLGFGLAGASIRLRAARVRVAFA